MLGSLSDRLAAVLRLLEEQLDVVEGRITSEEPPAWCTRRGLAAFLLELSESELEQCEREGLASWALRHPQAPEALRDMAEAVRSSTDLGPSRVATLAGPVLEGASQRKRAQLGAWYEVLSSPGGMLHGRGHQRIVDLGAGRGHLTRWASEMLGVPALGVEREEKRVERARAIRPTPTVRFDRRDALREPMLLDLDDLAVGLHACGDLGDALLDAAQVAGCDVVLLPCCPQKTAAKAWRPRSTQGGAKAVCVSRDALGLANTTPHDQGVEVSMTKTMQARQARYAVRMLLESRGLQLEPGEEMRSINRRRARQGLAVLASMAFAHRGLTPPTDVELAWAQAEGERQHAQVRRLSLPRSMMARVIEVAHALDRARELEEEGYAVDVFPLVDPKITPRNLTIVGLAPRRPARRLDASPVPEAP